MTNLQVNERGIKRWFAEAQLDRLLTSTRPKNMIGLRLVYKNEGAAAFLSKPFELSRNVMVELVGLKDW